MEDKLQLEAATIQPNDDDTKAEASTTSEPSGSQIIRVSSTPSPPSEMVSPSKDSPPRSSSATGKPLSPWHKWLLKKEVDRREQIKKFKLLQKSITSPKKATGVVSKKTLEEKEKIVNEWIRKKDQAWREKQRSEALALQERLAKEQELKDITAKMAKLKFKAWKDKKQEEAKLKVSQKIDMPEPEPKEQQEVCENAYRAWLETVRDREKRQIAFRQRIVRGTYAKPTGDRNRKQGKPQRNSTMTKRSVLCVLYCAKNIKR